MRSSFPVGVQSCCARVKVQEVPIISVLGRRTGCDDDKLVRGMKHSPHDSRGRADGLETRSI